MDPYVSTVIKQSLVIGAAIRHHGSADLRPRAVLEAAVRADADHASWPADVKCQLEAIHPHGPSGSTWRCRPARTEYNVITYNLTGRRITILLRSTQRAARKFLPSISSLLRADAERLPSRSVGSDGVHSARR